MYPRTPGEYTGPTPYGQGGPHPGESMDDFYETIHSQWPGVEASPYGGVHHPYNTAAAFPSNAILTPISLPDSSFVHARPSPVLSHHSQEYAYGVTESVPPHGLGITATFPSDFPRTVTAGLDLVPDPDYGFSGAALSPPPLPPAKRARRSPKSTVATREGPVNILPHPEGLQRLEQERRREQVDTHPHQRPRAPGRGRRDPQAEEEDAFVERLREQNLAWKIIREMFREKFNKDASEARLQMRMLRRRKERLTRWDENDIQLLIRARDYWEREKFNLIAQKMRELGSRKPYTAPQCEAQLRYLDSRQEPGDTSILRIPDPQRTRKRAMMKPSRGPATVLSA